MRASLIALLCLLAAPAAAQTPLATPELTRAAEALGAIWRPIEGPITAETLRNACAGADAEVDALDAAMPAVLTPESSARVRGLRGLHIVPIAGTPGAAYFFPPLGMNWFTSGLGVFAPVSEGEGFIAVRDAGGQELAFQLGRAGQTRILRVRQPSGTIVNFAGCMAIPAMTDDESVPG